MSFSEDTLSKLVQKLDRKHLLVVGGDVASRKRLIDAILERTHYETFRFPSGMTTLDEYMNFVKREKLYDPWYPSRGGYNYNAVIDFHHDWISDNHSLVVLEEINHFEETWKIEWLKAYIEEVANRRSGQRVIHLIVSQERESGLLSEIEKNYSPPDTDRRTARQVIDGSVDVVDIAAL